MTCSALNGLAWTRRHGFVMDEMETSCNIVDLSYSCLFVCNMCVYMDEMELYVCNISDVYVDINCEYVY
jgi:hypothetical protein